MPAVTEQLKAYFAEQNVAYEIIHHPPHYTAQQIAADTHTPGVEFAKTVFLKVDGKDAVAVLPAHHHVDCEKLSRELGAKVVRLETEAEMHVVMDEHGIECELGAIPPFGNLYDLPVYASQAMSNDKHITFNAGTHEDVMRIGYAQFEALVKPQVIDFSHHIEPPQQHHAEE